ncbi:MAG: hypothetical protein ABEH78_00170 [Haloferacaceae archaeon]
MDDIAEKRVHDARREATVAHVASETGLVRISVAADRVGRFELARRGAVRDVAAAGGTVVVATGEDVVVDREPTGFGPAVAVGADRDGTPLAVDDEGRIARRTPNEPDGWDALGRVADARAVDAGLVAAADGVHRVTPDGLAHAGLTDARDVAGAGRPLAATGDGLYVLGNGWLDRLDGPFRAVAAAPDGRATAVGDGMYVRTAADAGWRGVDLPDGVAPTDVVDVGHAPDARYAVTGDGTILADAGDGWRRRALGMTGVRRLAVGGAADAD